MLFWERIAPQDVLYLFGAGHISTCLAPLAKKIGFRVVVIDDRSEYCNRERFPEADEVIVAPFTEVFNQITITPTSYVAIVTRGHLFDLTVLKSALCYKPAYIGMIGSLRKIKMVFASLAAEGISEERLKEVHAPIGLDLGGETPEEIAISIAAELIKERASLKRSLKVVAQAD